MAAVITDNARDPTPPIDTLLFVNIIGPTDGRHRDASTQRKIRQHVMRDVTKVHRKVPRNRRFKLNTAALVRKDGLEDKTNNAIKFGASPQKEQTEGKKDDENVTGATGLRNSALKANAPATIIPSIVIKESPLNTLSRYLPECQHPAALLDFTLKRHPLSVSYQGLVGTSKLPAYSLAYAVVQNVNLDHASGRRFSFPFAFKEAPFCDKVLTGRNVREMVRSSLEQSITVALKQFTDVLSCIRRRLASSDLNVALSDDTILAVIDSICCSFTLKDLSQVRCHLDGFFSEQPDIQLMIHWVDVTAALIFERIPRFPLPFGLLPVQLRAEMSETIWDILNLVSEVESMPYVENKALFDALTEATWIARTIESESFTRGDAAWHDTVFLEQAVTAGVPGISAAVGSARGLWTFTAGMADLHNQQPIELSHIFGIGSITKLFTTVVIFQLIEEGRLHLSDTVGQLLDPEIYKNIDNAAEATITLLLTHHTGIDNWEDDPKCIRASRGSNLDPAHKWRKTEPLEYLRRPRLTAPERGNYYYSNTNYELLGFIIESITQNTAEGEIRRRIIEPLGMEYTFLEIFEPKNKGDIPRRYHFATESYRETAGMNPTLPEIDDGKLIDCTASNLSVEWTAGGMLSTPPDLVKFATALRDGRLLSEESLTTMKKWQPTTNAASEIGHCLFKMKDSEGNAWLGHFGGVLGFTGALWWKDDGDCVLSVLSNVGTMHSGKVPTSGAHILLETKLREIAIQLASIGKT
ncbi:beta-lactamase/transpeptidase-like protein [Trichoderma evansii]